MLQIRISTPDFSSGINFTNPIILENADEISLKKSVNISDESISFSIPTNDPKIQYITELSWWECWDTKTNQRENFGPIETIDKSTPGVRKIQGPGRSAILNDYFKTVQTFYYPISQFLDDLRYENISGEPRTSTIITKSTDSDFYGLSSRTKDNIIDENIGYLSPGRDTPSRGQLKTDQFWSGIAKADTITVDLGDSYKISKARILLPWWGALTINNHRSYDWSLLYSDTDPLISGAAYTSIYDSISENVTRPETRGKTLYMGEAGFEKDQESVSDSPIEARYWQVDISDTYAYYAWHLDGNNFSDSTSDEWDWECGGSNTFQGDYWPSPNPSGEFNKITLSPDSDCHASVVEVEISKKILDSNTISDLYYQQIENNNRQITYYHIPEASEMIDTATEGTRKYEPGTFFRHANITYGTIIPPLTITDEYNTVLYTSNTIGSDVSLEMPAYTKHLKIVGSPDCHVTYVDTWLGKLDPLSYGGSYSYTTVIGDYLKLHFRGVSLKWFSTVPEDSTAGEVSIELRAKDTAGGWSDWDMLESSFTLPINISGEKVWEITYESGILQDSTVYELRITNLNGGYVSIDAFTGYWSASFSDLNEDDPRFYVRFPNDLIQQYGPKYSNSSIYEYPITTPAFTRQSLSFTGDRIIVYSYKNPDAGTIKLGLSGIDIPGGDADGGLTIDLSSPNHIYQAVIFDSNEVFTPSGLPWGNWTLGTYQRNDSTGPMYLDGMGIHANNGLSVKFDVSSHLDILKSTIEALQMEADIDEEGLIVVPRLGVDTDIILREGTSTVININDVEDISKLSTMLQVTGSDIDGLPLTGIVEDKLTRKLFGRTIQRSYDLRNIADYFTLIGAARAELIKRRVPEKRVSVVHTGELNIRYGDSFIVSKEDKAFRIRAMSVTRNQSRGQGTVYEVEGIVWPQIP